MNSESLIHLDNIKKVFLTDEVETHALAGVHFGIARGEYVSISGPSGCGKSTLLAILGLLDTPSEGSYRLNGREVASIDAGERARIRNQEIGFVFQAFNLIPTLTAEENIVLPMSLAGRKADEAWLDEIVATVGQMKEENRALRQRQDLLISERANLLQKNEQVRARVEAMIGRLKSMEHGS